MKPLRTFWAVTLAAFYLMGAGTQPAHAHFLWAQLLPGAQPTFRLVFTEQAGENTIPALLERIKPDRAQTADGVSLQLRAAGNALEAVAPQGTRVAGVAQTWGVLDLGGDFSKGDGSHEITFASEDHSPLGRQVTLNDELKSFYRVRDRQIMEVTRTMGNQRFTITMLENVVVDGDKYLPKYFVVTYFNAQTGALERTECFSDTHTQVGTAWLPTGRRVVTASRGIISTRSYELKDVRLLTTQQAQGGR